MKKNIKYTHIKKSEHSSGTLNTLEWSPTWDTNSCGTPSPQIIQNSIRIRSRSINLPSYSTPGEENTIKKPNIILPGQGKAWHQAKINKFLKRIESEGVKHGLKLNKNKCEVMHNARTANVHFADGTRVPRKDEVKNLGISKTRISESTRKKRIKDV